ncbi:MAG: arginine--tRNA ligase [Candidatus Diapherotrites archaeon]|nr:arginine--tRNA ligase [Candidatus Diapherotrites archaeon]
MTNTYKTQAAEYVKTAVSKLVEDNTSFDTEKILSSIEVPPDSKLGDFSSTICFDLSKILKKSPALIAKDIVEEINSSIESNSTKKNSFKKTEVAGPGYINFFLDFEKFAKATIQNAVKENFAPNATHNPQTVSIESPSVNPGKPLHIGHARNAILGMIISNIFESLGNKVIRMDYIDDLGLQVAQTVWGYKNLNDQPDPDMKLDQWQGKQYVEVAKKMDDEKVKSEVDAIMNKMEEGKNETATYADEIAMASIDAQKITTQRLNSLLRRHGQRIRPCPERNSGNRN